MACDPQTLLTDAQCIECGVDVGLQIPVLIALAAQIAGVSLDSQSLMDRAVCIESCIEPGLRLPVLVSLACEIAGV